jgi:predicted transcriptional regulator
LKKSLHRGDAVEYSQNPAETSTNPRVKKSRSGRPKKKISEDETPPSIADLSRLELICLNVLWQKPKATVREVREALLPARPLAYTTVMTILGRMYAKKAVRRTKQGKTFHYEPVLEREEACEQALRSVLDFYFAGSIERLQDYLRQLSTPGPSSEAWNEISADLL